MATDKPHKRVSSLFGLRRDESTSTISRSSDTSQYHYATQDAKSLASTLQSQRYTPPRSRLASSQSLQAIPFNASSDSLEPPRHTTVSDTFRSRSSDRVSKRTVSESSRERSRSRPQTPLEQRRRDSCSRPTTPDSAKLGKKKIWFSGRNARIPVAQTADGAKAWIAGLIEHVPYDLTPLFHGKKVGWASSPAT